MMPSRRMLPNGFSRLEGKIWGERWDLNPRPSVPQTDALPTELRSPQIGTTELSLPIHSTALQDFSGGTTFFSLAFALPGFSCTDPNKCLRGLSWLTGYILPVLTLAMVFAGKCPSGQCCRLAGVGGRRAGGKSADHGPGPDLF
jgi:hypothetical protein